MITRARKRLAVAVAVAVFILLTQVDRLLTAPYDSWTHAFFASHYIHDWFSSIDLRWYLGFPVISYPPLAHQTLAVISLPFIWLGWTQASAIELAYTVISFALTVLYPLAVYFYSKAIVSRRAASYAAIIGSLFTGWWTLLLGYGQFPGIMGAVITMFGGWALFQALNTGGFYRLVIATLLTALVPMVHHFTTVSFLVAAYSVVVISYVLGKSSETSSKVEQRARLTQSIKRAAPIAVCSIFIALVTLVPFVQFLLTGPTQPVIPHGSRQSWLQGTVWNRPQLYQTLISGSLFVISAPLAGYVAFRHNQLPAAVSATVSIIFAILSLGFTTPLPQLIYGGFAETLTYFRFGAWGGFLLLPAAGLLTAKTIDSEVVGLVKQYRPSCRGLIFAFICALLISQVVIASQMTSLAAASPDRRATADEIGDFMSQDEHWKWRYLSLGTAQELGLIGINAPAAQTIDGNYNTGRLPSNIPVLARSSASQISSAKFSPSGSLVLEHYLANNRRYGIKFVFSVDSYYESTLREHGFQLLCEWEWIDARAWYDPNTPTANESKQSPAQEGEWVTYTWGVLPLTTLSLLLLVLASSIVSD